MLPTWDLGRAVCKSRLHWALNHDYDLAKQVKVGFFHLAEEKSDKEEWTVRVGGEG